MNASSDDASASTTTSFKKVRFCGTVVTPAHLESVLSEDLTVLELKDVKIQGLADDVKLPQDLVELTVDNCPDIMHMDPKCVTKLSHLKKFTLGTDNITESVAEVLNAIDAEVHLILYGHRAMETLDCVHRVRRLRSLRIRATGLVGIGDKQPSLEDENFDETETDLYLSILDDIDADHPVDDPIPTTTASPTSTIDVEELEISASNIAGRYPFWKFKNVRNLKLWAEKELDAEVLKEIGLHMEHLEILHFGGSVVLDAKALSGLLRLKKLKEVLISNAMILPGGLRILKTLSNRPRLELRCCKSMDEFCGD